VRPQAVAFLADT